MRRKPLEWIVRFRENLSIKLLALALATISIYSIQRITNQTEEFEVPIKITPESGMAVLQQDARYAYVTCRGSLDDLRRLDQSQIRLVVRPRTSGRTGPEQVPIGIRNVQGVPRSISVTKVRPNLLHLTLDREVEKQISVARPELLGEPALGRAEVEFSPKIVTVRGPEELLGELKIMETPPIDVEGATVSFNRDLPLLTDHDAGVWDITPTSISARVNIVTEAISREWTDIPVHILQPPDTDLVFKLSPRKVNINLLGSAQTLHEMETEAIRVFVDATNITEPGEYERTANVNIDRGTDIRSAITPPVIQITAKHIAAVQTTNDAPATATTETSTENDISDTE